MSWASRIIDGVILLIVLACAAPIVAAIAKTFLHLLRTP